MASLLFDFVIDGTHYRYNNSEDDIVNLSQTYSPAPITLEDFNITAALEKEQAMIRMARNEEMAILMTEMVNSTVTVDVYSNFSGTYIIIWSGRVRSPVWSDASVSFVCDPITALFNAPVVYRLQTRQCAFQLYDQNTCKVTKSAFRKTLTITAISDDRRRITGTMTGVTDTTVFLRGIMSYSDAGLSVKRYITNILDNSGGSFTVALSYPVSARLKTSWAVSVYFGCDKTLTTCRSRFNNARRFGGFDGIPNRDVQQEVMA